MEDLWNDYIVLNNTGKYAMLKVTSSALKFKMKAIDFGTQSFNLISDQYETIICNVCINQKREGIVVLMQVNSTEKAESNLLNINLEEYQEFWVTWYNGVVQMGRTSDYQPFVSLKLKNNDNMLKYARFDTSTQGRVELVIEVSPINFKNADYKVLDSNLRWETVDDNNKIPPDAIVGGFENEPLYIARAHHNNSLCPGKYVRSKAMAFVPWGGRQHGKDDFEVLCGYDYQWVKSKGHFIPENAFVAGRSEVRGEPLYVARAKYEDYLIPGKVHALYGTCYLPFNGREIELGEYEILVRPSVVPRGHFFEDI